MKLWHLAVASCALLVSSGTALAGVIVVDPAGGGSFSQVQPAVNAALDGDTILVKPGNYPVGFTINGKGLTVVGDVGMNTFTGKVQVQNLSSGQLVTLANLKAFGTLPEPYPLRVLNCAGAIRIVNCDWYGKHEPAGAFGAERAAWITNSDRFALAGCKFVGGDGGQLGAVSCTVGTGNGSYGGNAFFVENSSIAMYDTLIRGGKGGNGESATAPGGMGVMLFDGFMFAGRSNITGGQGGSPMCTGTCPDVGGAGWYIAPIASGWELECMVSGGLGGNFSAECRPSLLIGQTYWDEDPFQFAAASIGFTIPHIAREGTFVTVTFVGPPGARVFLNDGLTTTHEPTAIWRGVLIAPFPEQGSGPERERRWGIIPPSGELTQIYKVPLLPSGEQAQTRFLQAYRVGANGITLGSFRTLTVLDSTF